MFTNDGGSSYLPLGENVDDLSFSVPETTEGDPEDREY